MEYFFLLNNFLNKDYRFSYMSDTMMKYNKSVQRQCDAVDIKQNRQICENFKVEIF